MQQIEDFLRSQLQSNQQAGILRSENRVTKRLLASPEEMAPIYSHLARNLQCPHQWKLVVGRIVTVAAYWSPRRMLLMRKMRDRLIALDDQIAESADGLFRCAALLDKRAKISERYPFDVGDGDGRFVDLMEEAGRNVSPQSIAQPFIGRLLPELERLREEFDETYWPSFPAIIHALALHYWRRHRDKPTYEPLDSLTAAALSRQHSVRVFVRALDADIVQLQEHTFANLPRGFHLSPKAVSAIAAVALNLKISEANVIKARK